MLGCKHTSSPTPPGGEDPDATSTASTGPTGTTDTGTPIPDGPWLTDDRYVLLRHATQVRPEPGEWGFGAALTAGSDLDHDGIAEWTTSAPQVAGYTNRYVVVASYEGSQRTAQRNPLDFHFEDGFGESLAAGDVDGDSWADLLFASGGTPPLLHVATQTNASTDAAIELQSKSDAYPATAIHLEVDHRVHEPSPVLIVSYTSTDRVSFGVLPTEPSLPTTPIQVSLDDITVLSATTNSGEFEAPSGLQTDLVGDGLYDRYPTVALGVEKVAVLWVKNPGGFGTDQLQLASFDRDGHLLGEQQLLADGGNGNPVHISHVGADVFFVAWAEPTSSVGHTRMFGQFVDLR